MLGRIRFMRFVIQRVKHAKVTIDNEVHGSIGEGFLVFIGIADNDTKAIADKMVSKLLGMRIFNDQNDKINLSLDAVDGGLLLISQFTLYADCKKGNRPSFTRAARPELANEMYEYIVDKCKEGCPIVETGIFAADMKVELYNDGPFTIILDSDEIM